MISSSIEVVMYPKISVTALTNGNGFVNSQLLGGFMSIGVRDTAATLTGALTTLTDNILERPNIKTVFFNSNDSPTAIRSSFSMHCQHCIIVASDSSKLR